ncbi:MAG: hypothetical protein EZS28_029165 [Streblomastix strix]|uniref:Uncharacterized protein n=1 Tax=Streblomastix strix TaxID=222440 RepID=A0A5J4UXT8_9EUKA|nr:MAG: hypothetical protein EZS28_029165 [Streblomastix strix]
MRAPTTIRNQIDLVDYKRFIRKHIIQMQEKTIMDTKEKIIGIFSIMIQVFRLPHAGAGGVRTIPSLKKHIMRREIRYIDTEKNNQNLCFFLAYSFIMMPDIKAEGSVAAKRYKEHSRIAEAKRLFQRIHGKRIDDNYNGNNGKNWQLFEQLLSMEAIQKKRTKRINQRFQSSFNYVGKTSACG